MSEAPAFFATAAELRDWLERNHDSEAELWVGFYKKGSGRPSITWPELVDEALCFGWIDGVRKGVDADTYKIRLTPRRKRSTWSAVNIARARELVADGRMRPAGVEAFEARTDDNSAIYSYERRKAAKLEPEQERRFQANAEAAGRPIKELAR